MSAYSKQFFASGTLLQSAEACYETDKDRCQLGLGRLPAAAIRLLRVAGPFAEAFPRKLHQFLGAVRPVTTERSEFLTGHFVVRGEEVLNFLQEIRGEVLDGMDALLIPKTIRHCNKPIVSLGTGFVRLFGLDDADKARRHLATNRDRFLHQEQHVKGIAILPHRGRNKPEVNREHQPARENSL